MGTATPCTYRVWVVLSGYTLTVKQEADARDVLSLSVAESVHELTESGCALDFEEDFVVVVRDFDVEVLALAILGLLLNVGATVVRHCGFY
jgi:hypothetical protein